MILFQPQTLEIMKRYIIFLMMLALPNLLAAQMLISLPIKGVYQNTGSTTPVELAGQYVGSSLSNYRIEYNVIRLNVSNGSYNSTYQNYTPIVTNPTHGIFKTTLNLPIGWYEVNVRVNNLASGVAGSYSVIKFGIGDVYVIAGQSNAQGLLDNAGNWSVPSISTYDGIVSHNWYGPCNAGLPPYPVMTALNGLNKIAPSGNNSWNWAKLGQNLQSGSPNGGLPIAFFNAAAGGSTSNNWSESAAGINTDNIYLSSNKRWCAVNGYPSTSPAQPYFDLKTTLKYYASIFGAKTLLWHQGEADNDKQYASETARGTYRTNLLNVISKSRSDISSSFRWFVSEVSFNGKSPLFGGSATRSDVTSAQDDVVSSTYDPSDYNYKGVITDPLGLPYRDVNDLVHFREDRSMALSTLGNLWSSKVTIPTNFTKVGATKPPNVYMIKSGSNWSLYVSGTYSEYRWLDMGSPSTNSPFGTNYFLSGSTGGSYACLVKDNSGNWTITQTIYTNCGSCREGVAETWQEEDLGLSTRAYPVPFDDEFTIEFTIPTESQVRLELINLNGEVISKIADNMHARGTYKYPVKSPNLSAGIIFYRLTVNGLAITKKLVKVN